MTRSPRRRFLQSALLGAAGLVATRAAAQTVTVSPAVPTLDFWDVVRSRRSVRRFRPDSVPEADVTRILDAARLAPTAGNQQPWKFLVVRDSARIKAMKAACLAAVLERHEQNPDPAKPTRAQIEERFAATYEGLCSAPLYIIVLTDSQSKYPTFNPADGALAAGTLLLAARALGYGTVYVTDAIPERVTRDVFKIPERYTRVCITPVGIPVEWPHSPTKRPLEEFVAHEKLPA